jgi:hypothetical protein
VIALLVLVSVVGAIALALIYDDLMWRRRNKRQAAAEPDVEENARPLGNVEVLDRHRGRS